MPPSDSTPLLGSSSNMGYYASIDARLSEPMPEERSKTAPAPPTNDDYLVDMERLTLYPSPDARASTCIHQENRNIFFCDYCVRHKLPPPQDGDHRGLWERCMESEGSLAVLESMIRFQMRLLSILVPLVLVFILGCIQLELVR
ncbi:uncharacterized protein GGS25DRAFT_523243 [Hypoxylon fragiforme]|uniref:uncharacterized protein n=1 Tax=Hypoxylon fragiforme TaxID=63214 RepID=UPI0020C64957|nr:uncharacterized protein GGS25DRAFT_523243 [Hypoxylon fragiforme]KAI2607718.1 hypothetical protein GGS25DRAFT_523243 [Hypoxylon fragiforme]